MRTFRPTRANPAECVHLEINVYGICWDEPTRWGMLRKKAAVLNSMVCGRSLGEMAGQ